MNVFEVVKASVSVPDAAKMYSIQIDPHGMAKCPFHDGRHPSLKLNRDFYYCFGCGATGDVIDFVSRLYGLNAFEAAKKLVSDFGLDPDRPPSGALAKPRHPMIRAFREDERYCHWVLCDYLHLLEDWKVRYGNYALQMFIDCDNMIIMQSINRLKDMEGIMDCKTRVRELRKLTGMNRKEFCAYFQIPYQTVTDWELGHRQAPDYLLRLLEYYIRRELLKNETE